VSGLLLGIETSCDETAAAVVRGGRTVLSSIVSSQVDLHARFGGVVPEIAGRAHLELLPAAVAAALEQAGHPQVEAVAATAGPGLIGSLLVGLSAAKALALVWEVPFVGVNHLEAHLFAASLEDPEVAYPLVVLLVSGGHTMLILLEEQGRYRLLGQTVDDAAGEAFDKVARFLGLGYPGGPAIERASAEGDPAAVPLPRPLSGQGLDFSFSGLKTAVITYVRVHPFVPTADVAASFQAAVVDVSVEKTLAAARQHGARGLCLAGGVAANSLLRQRITEAGSRLGLSVHLPSRAMCTDNAAMVAAAGWWKITHQGPSPLDLPADPNLPIAFDQAEPGGLGSVATGTSGRYR
jgi:N6-L-threonylcarbamoyladenine synthase